MAGAEDAQIRARARRSGEARRACAAAAPRGAVGDVPGPVGGHSVTLNSRSSTVRRVAFAHHHEPLARELGVAVAVVRACSSRPAERERRAVEAAVERQPVVLVQDRLALAREHVQLDLARDDGPPWTAAPPATSGSRRRRGRRSGSGPSASLPLPSGRRRDARPSASRTTRRAGGRPGGRSSPARSRARPAGRGRAGTGRRCRAPCCRPGGRTRAAAAPARPSRTRA